MKTIAAKYVAPLVLAVGMIGGFVGFELSQAFTLSLSEMSVRSDKVVRRHVENPQANPSGYQNQGDRKRPSSPVEPTPIL